MLRPEKHKLLISDDSEINRLALSRIMCNEFQIDVAHNGLKGLELLQKNVTDILRSVEFLGRAFIIIGPP